MSQKVEINGEEVEVFTTEEVAAQVAAGKAAVEGEYKPKIEGLQTELTGARTALSERAGEFAKFRKLSDEQVSQLAEKDRIIYENGLALHQAHEKNAAADKLTYDNAVSAAIKAKVGSDEALITKVKNMYELVNLQDRTPEEISTRVAAALGAISQTEPDLLATAGFSGGSFEPPKPKGEEKQTFADTDAGKELAGKLGLKTEIPKK